MTVVSRISSKVCCYHRLRHLFQCKFNCDFDSISGKPFFPRIEDHITEESSGFVDGLALPLSSPARSSPHSQSSDVNERFSRKVFVGGLPPDIDEGKLNLLRNISIEFNCFYFPILVDEITSSFRRFGPLVVDWPHKAESKSYFPPKGYAFLLFQVSETLINSFEEDID